MNFKNSIRSTSLVLMTVALMSVTSVNQDVFAVDAGMSLTATAEDGSNTISLTGTTTANTPYVSIVVISPNGENRVSVDELTPDANGEFSTDISVGGSYWSQDGLYTITASHGGSNLYSITVSVEVSSGMTAETSATESSLVSNQSNNDLAEISTESTEEISGLSIEADAMEGSDTIRITGQTSKTNEDVTFTVTSPNGNRVGIDQVTPDASGNFATDIAVGGPLWSQDGMYTVVAQQGSGSAFTDSVNYGSLDNNVTVELTGGVAQGESPEPASDCGSNEISADGNCIPYEISGGMVTSATVNTNDNSVIINIDANDDGILTISPSESTQSGIFMVLVDGEESNDAKINGNTVTVPFFAGSEQIEIIGTFVIPEFGTIAAMILAVAIISIIAISAKSRLSIVPRY
jgi:predicted secreted protein with PEFG-CTERM motif